MQQQKSLEREVRFSLIKNLFDVTIYHNFLQVSVVRQLCEALKVKLKTVEENISTGEKFKANLSSSNDEKSKNISLLQHEYKALLG